MKRQLFISLLGATFASSLIVAACTDDSSLLQPEAPAASENVTAATPSSPLDVGLGTGQCMGNDAVDAGVVSGFANDPLAFNCTANDVRIANARTLSGVPIQCVPGQPLNDVDIVADIVETSTSVRHDIGIWVENGDNGVGGAEDGQCDFFYFDNGDISAEAGVIDGDGDACGDMENAGTVNDFDLGGLDLVCPTNPVVVDGKSYIEIASCVSWTQPGGDRVCPIPGESSPDGARFGTLPANKSKCNCEPFLVEIELLAQLTLLKKVVNDDGGTATDTMWTLTAAGPDTISGKEGDSAITSAAVAPGVYALSESNGPSDYTEGSWSCTGDGTLSGSSLTLESGDVASCEITNDDDPAILTLLKKVVNDAGGTATDTMWTLTAAGPDTISGKEGDSAITSAQVSAGVYALSESTGPSGYMAGSWSCSGDGSLNGSDLTLAIGDTASCEITNMDNAAVLTLLKKVVNDDGGTATDTMWTLTAAGPDTISGKEGASAITSAAVAAGVYALSESNGPSGYTEGSWSCTGGGTLSGSDLTMALGDTASCEITNDDDPAVLTLLKKVVNDDGGTATDTMWTLTAAGPDTISGKEGDSAITSASITAGTYALSESGGPTGYTMGSWSCTGGTQSGSSITLKVGESASCEITNDDILQACEKGDRLTSVSLQLTAANPDPITIGVTDDNGKNGDLLASSPGLITTGTTFTIVPDGSATFFDSQNLRFFLNGEPSKDLKVHLSCSDDPMVGDVHSGSANGALATLEKTGFSATQFN